VNIASITGASNWEVRRQGGVAPQPGRLEALPTGEVVARQVQRRGIDRLVDGEFRRYLPNSPSENVPLVDSRTPYERIILRPTHFRGVRDRDQVAAGGVSSRHVIEDRERSADVVQLGAVCDWPRVDLTLEVGDRAGQEPRAR